MEEKNAAWWWHQCSFFSVLSKTRRNDKIRILRGFNFVIKSVNLLTESALESCRLMEFNRNINFYLDHLKHLTSKDILKNAFNDCTLKVWVQRSGILATLLLCFFLVAKAGYSFHCESPQQSPPQQWGLLTADWSGLQYVRSLTYSWSNLKDTLTYILYFPNALVVGSIHFHFLPIILRSASSEDLSEWM